MIGQLSLPNILCFVEKKLGFDVKRQSLDHEAQANASIEVLNRMATVPPALLRSISIPGRDQKVHLSPW